MLPSPDEARTYAGELLRLADFAETGEPRPSLAEELRACRIAIEELVTEMRA